MNLSNWKLILGGGGAIILLLMLANHYENQGIREEEGKKWELAIARAKPTVVHDTVKIPIPPIIGTAHPKTVPNWEYFAETVHSNNDQTPEKCDSLLQYCNYLLQPFSVFADTAGIALDLTANPRTQSIDYKLTLPPKEVERINTTDQVLEPPIERNWLFGLSLEYKEKEPGIGAMLGVKPITLGATYFKDSPILWRVGVQWEF